MTIRATMRDIFRPSSLKAGLITGGIVALAGLLPMAATAQDSAVLQSSLGVANVTTGDTAYKQSVDAANDQIVKVQLYYANQEAQNSGHTANNLRAKITMPTGSDVSKTVTSSIKGDNTSATTQQVTVNTGNAGAVLQYIPGSALWKHNTGSADAPKIEETQLSDDIVTTAQGVALGNQQPGDAYAATITVQARVVSPGVKVTLQSQKKGATNQWSANNQAAPGDTLRYLVSYQNTSSSEQKDVTVHVNLPAGTTIGAGTTTITNASNPSGIKASSDNVTAAGIDIGNYTAGSNAFVAFDVNLPAAGKLQCGDNQLNSTATVQPQGLQQYFATAITTVKRDCTTAPTAGPSPAPAPAPAPSYSCDKLTIDKLGDRTVQIKVSYTTANGAVLKSVTYDFGDGTTPLTTDQTSVQHTYAKDGDYAASATLLVTANGKDQTVTTNACSQTVSFAPATSTPQSPPTAPTANPGALPGTGPGEVLGIAAAVAVVAAVGHTLYLRRRLS